MPEEVLVGVRLGNSGLRFSVWVISLLRSKLLCSQQYLEVFVRV